MPTESKSRRKKRSAEILYRLKDAYPGARCSLQYQSPFQLLIATILSAQCTDERVNRVTDHLFQKYQTPEDFAALSQEDIGRLIYSTGFYNNKAKSIKALSQTLLDEHGGKVPSTMSALVKLPGVGRKTANVVLGSAFQKPGLVVDTHVTRIANLLGLVKSRNAVIIERELCEIIPETDWTILGHLFIDHGRAVCIARRPRCQDCILQDLCPGSKN